MAITPACKVTYSLRPETVAQVEELAVKWGVPKSEVIRRAVHGINQGNVVVSKLTPLEALKELQNHAGLTKAKAKKFMDEVQLSRRAAGRKRG